MKAIYLNIDPYLQAVADWLNAGKPGTAPHFDPLPVAVTIPLGESVCVFAQDGDIPLSGSTVQTDPPDACNVTWEFSGIGDSPTKVAENVNLGFSSVLENEYATAYAVGSAGSFSASATIDIGEGPIAIIPFTVLVRRETAQGPVDLVDFTPPAAAPSAADIKSALVAAGDGALAGVSLGGAYLRVTNEENTPTNPTYGVYGDEPFNTETGSTFSIRESDQITAPLGNPSAS